MNLDSFDEKILKAPAEEAITLFEREIGAASE